MKKISIEISMLLLRKSQRKMISMLILILMAQSGGI